MSNNLQWKGNVKVFLNLYLKLFISQRFCEHASCMEVGGIGCDQSTDLLYPYRVYSEMFIKSCVIFYKGIIRNSAFFKTKHFQGRHTFYIAVI